MEIARGIHLLKYRMDNLWTGIYLLAREKLVVIDTAFEPAIEGLLYPYLSKPGRRPSDIDMVINTHIHGDHINGNARLLADTHAKFCAHHLGREKLRNPYYYLNLIRRRFVPIVPYQEITCGLTPQEIDCDLHDGDKIDLGDSVLNVIHTPGHTGESISLYDTASRILFTGDALQGRGTLSTGVAYYADLGAYRETVDRVGLMLARGVVTSLAPSHPFDPIGGVIPSEEGMHFVETCRKTIEQYTNILRDYLIVCAGKPDIQEAVQLLLRHAGLTTQPSIPVLAYHTAEAHLQELLPTFLWSTVVCE